MAEVKTGADKLLHLWGSTFTREEFAGHLQKLLDTPEGEEFIQTWRDIFHGATEWVAQHRAELHAFAVACEQWPAAQQKRLRIYGDACMNVGWPPTLQLPFPSIREIVGMSQRGVAPDEIGDTLETLWLEHFTDTRVEELVRRWWMWRRVMEPRYEILQGGLECHLRGDYGSAVLRFVTQFEGILVAAFAHKGHLSGHGVKGKRPDKAFLELLVAAHEDVSGGPLTLEYARKVMFGSFEHGAPVQGLNRHAILHGADTTYPTKIRSLQAIVAVDLLVEILGLIVTNDDKFHRPGCELLRGLPQTSISRVCRADIDPRTNGLDPCPKCHDLRVQAEPDCGL